MRRSSVDISCLLTLFLSAALLLGPTTANADAFCDGELRSVHGLLALLEGSLTRGELDPNDVQLSFQREPWVNPYSLAPKSIQNLSALRGFARTRAKLTASQRAEFLEKLRSLLQRTNHWTNAVGVAKEETAELLSLKTIHILDQTTSVGTIFFGHHHGRPVFVQQMWDNHQSGLFLIDYNAGKPTTRLLSDSLGTISAANDQNPIFHWQGRAYIFNSATRDFYDLESGKTVTFGGLNRSALFPRGSKNSRLQSARVISMGNTLRLISFWYDTTTIGRYDLGQLYSVDLVGPNREFTLIAEGSPRSIGNLGKLGSQETIVSVFSGTDPKLVNFLDVSQSPITRATISVMDDRVNENCTPLVFTRNGGKFALILTTTNAGFPNVLRLYDLTHERYLRDLNVSTPDFTADELVEMSLREVDGHPYALMHFASGFALFDLVAERIVWSQRQIFRANAKVFHWHNNAYLLMSTLPANEIEVREFATGLMHSKMTSPDGSIQHTIPFEVDGKLMGLGLPNPNLRPFFFRILTRD